jgi:hypothetical protein
VLKVCRQIKHYRSGKQHRQKRLPASRHESRQGDRRLQPWLPTAIAANHLLMTKTIADITDRAASTRGTCELVQGTIKVMYWCRLFVRAVSS